MGARQGRLCPVVNRNAELEKELAEVKAHLAEIRAVLREWLDAIQARKEAQSARGDHYHNRAIARARAAERDPMLPLQ